MRLPRLHLRGLLPAVVWVRGSGRRPRVSLLDIRVIAGVGACGSFMLLVLLLHLHHRDDRMTTLLAAPGAGLSDQEFVPLPSAPRGHELSHFELPDDLVYRPDNVASILGVEPAWPALPATCSASRPSTVIYNRIPKCGSGSVAIFISAAQERNDFQVCRSTMYTQRWLDHTDAQRYSRNPFVQSRCRRPINVSRPAVLNRHIFYFDFAARTRVLHINVMREPIKRCSSRFYYERDARGVVDAEATFDACIDHGECRFAEWDPAESVMRGHMGTHKARMLQLREECSSNYLTRWFCGMRASHCQPAFVTLGLIGYDNVTGTWTPPEVAKAASAKLALETAADNIVREHPVVGLVERMADTFRLFAATLPGFFAGVPDDKLGVCNKCNPNRTATTHPPPGPTQRALLRRLNALDVALYAYTERLFEARMRACGLTRR